MLRNQEPTTRRQLIQGPGTSFQTMFEGQNSYGGEATFMQCLISTIQQRFPPMLYSSAKTLWGEAIAPSP